MELQRAIDIMHLNLTVLHPPSCPVTATSGQQTNVPACPLRWPSDVPNLVRWLLLHGNLRTPPVRFSRTVDVAYSTPHAGNQDASHR